VFDGEANLSQAAQQQASSHADQEFNPQDNDSGSDQIREEFLEHSPPLLTSDDSGENVLQIKFEAMGKD
jgi:hypothetical protein